MKPMALAKPILAQQAAITSSQNSAKIEAEKSTLHPRNKHRQRYDFDALIKTSPALARFVGNNTFGDRTIDFADPKAVIALNSALLRHFYNIQNWRIPAQYLCPPIPGRADYVHNIADLLAAANGGVVPQAANVNVLDIGVGANMVYPIIGQREYGWRFVGADCDAIALKNAQQIIDANDGLADNITLRLQTNSANIFKGIISASDFFDITVCNPPFHASLVAAQAGTQRKWQQLSQGKSPNKNLKTNKLNFGGQGAELYCTGGEKTFINNMIAESAQFVTQCCWFTTLVSAASHLPVFYKKLKNVGAIQVKTINMAQGNKKSRILAWTFFNEKQQHVWRNNS
jgi:23S rRNA (adenine1618-N6)-methyltransferase